MTPHSFDLSNFLPYRLALLSERVSRRLSHEYGKSYGLSVADWRVLVHLLRCKEVSVRDIHNCVNLEKPRVSRTVSKLAASGLVIKAVADRDGRLKAISLTAKGHSLLQEVIPVALTFEKELLAVVTSEELRQFHKIAEKLHRALDEDPLAPPRSEIDKLASASE